jgi:hypothetical protein
MKNNKFLIWTLAISGLAIAGYVTFKLMNPPAPNKKVIDAAAIDKIGSFITGLFNKKSDTSANTQVNYYDRPLGDAGLDYPLETSVEDTSEESIDTTTA